MRITKSNNEKVSKDDLKRLKKRAQGITLIALVITIIVLLILAGLTISLTVGNNGIITKAQEAIGETEKAQELEKIQFAIAEAQIGENGYKKLNQSNLQSAINSQFQGRNVVVSDNGEETFTISFLDTLNEYIISDNEIEEKNYNEYINNATAQNINGKTIYAIDKNGNNVDMNNWEFCYDSQTNGYALNDEEVLNNSEYGGTSETRIRNKGYLGGFNETTGEIEGNVPMFIKEENGNWLPVTSMYNTFYNCTELKKAPEIPNTVICMWSTYQGCINLIEGKVSGASKNMWNCFMDCTSLVTSPSLPDSVENMMQTFYNCTALTSINKFPENVTTINGAFQNCSSLNYVGYINDNVTDMGNAFLHCTKLNKITNIGKNVTNLKNTFNQCSNLVEAPVIGNKVINMEGTFSGCSSLIEAPEIPEGVEIIRSTFNNCTNLVRPPSKIPASVINMISTFFNCNKLEGYIEINSNLTNEVADDTENSGIVGKTYYDECFASASINGKGLVISTTNPLLKENEYEILNNIVNTKNYSSQITIQY